MVGQCFPFCTAAATVAQVHYVLAHIPLATITQDYLVVLYAF